MRVNTNTLSMSAVHHMQRVTSREEDATLKLSSGNRVYRSSADPAGLAISQKMRAKIRSISQAERNTNDGISMVQVAEGVLGTIHTLAGRLRELAMRSASDTISDNDRNLADMEYQQLKNEISRLTKSSKFNGNHLLNDKGSVYDLQIGTTSDSNDRLNYDMKKVLTSLDHLGIAHTNIRSKLGAQQSLDPLMGAISTISGSRADLGAVSNRMVSAMSNLQIARENESSAKSRIRDADFALETANLAKDKIMKEASSTMLAHASHSPSAILNLL